MKTLQCNQLSVSFYIIMTTCDVIRHTSSPALESVSIMCWSCDPFAITRCFLLLLVTGDVVEASVAFSTDFFCWYD